MNYKYYRWFFFLDKKHEVIDIEKINIYFKTYFAKSIKSWVSIRVNYGREGDIYYHDVPNIEHIRNYHTEKFQKKNVLLVKRQSGAVILEMHPNFEFSGAIIFNFDKKGREIKSTRFNKDYELLDYCESYYGEGDDPISEKYFFPSVWKIQVEDYS